GTAALAADPDRQDRRMKHQGVGVGPDFPIRHEDSELTLFRPADRPSAQPSGAAGFVGQGDRLAPEEGRRDRLYLVRIGDTPTGRRFVERDAEAHIPGGGYR